MHSISLSDVPSRLRNIGSLFNSRASSRKSTIESANSQNPSISSSISSARTSSVGKAQNSKSPSVPVEHYIPPTPWKPTTNEPRRFSTVADFLLRRKSEPSCKPRKTSEKKFAQRCANWTPDRPLKYPDPPKKEHAQMLEAWTWEIAGRVKNDVDWEAPVIVDGESVDDDSCSCVSPCGSRRNSWSSAYWAEEKIRLQGGDNKPSENQEGVLGVLDALLKQEHSGKPRR